MENYRHLFPDLEEGLQHELQEKRPDFGSERTKFLIQSGQNIRNTMIVLEGLVKLYRESEEGGEFFMYHLHPGDGCALSLICDRTFRASSVTAKAVTDTVLLVVPISETENWMRQYRTWYHFVSGHLPQALRKNCWKRLTTLLSRTWTSNSNFTCVRIGIR